jgi:hypothetical protein
MRREQRISERRDVTGRIAVIPGGKAQVLLERRVG